MYRLGCGDGGRIRVWIFDEYKWTCEGIVDVEEGAEDSVRKPRFVELRHFRIDGLRDSDQGEYGLKEGLSR